MSSNGLKFGTSGLRGPVTAFTESDCLAYGISFAQLLKEKFPKCRKISLAGDLRESTPQISKYFISALSSQGFEVENLGFIPTPALAWWAIERGQASVMVTGSHIPADQNGVKFYTPLGEITKDDEVAISVNYQKGKETRHPVFQSVSQNLPLVQDLAENFYAQRYLQFFGSECLKGMKVAFYQHSGVGREVLPRILQGLGAEVQVFGKSSTFIPVDTENVKNISDLLGQLHNMKADVLASTDGDADRPLVIDAKYGLVRGDVLGIITSQLLNIRRIATPVSSTSLIEQIQYFTEVERTKIGSPFVIAGLGKLLKNSAEPCAGFEANGGYLIASEVKNSKGASLRPLATRDCLLPIVAFAVMKAQSRIEPLFKAFGSKTNLSGLVPHFPKPLSEKLIQILKTSPSDILSVNSGLAQIFGHPKTVDLLDGVKIISKELETLHFRPSGNAPEFRVYVEANTPERAQNYLDQALEVCSAFLRNNDAL